MTTNSGYWYSNANSGGLAIVNAWLARFFFQGVLKGEWFSGQTPALDQEVLNELILKKTIHDPQFRQIPVFKYNGTFKQVGWTNRTLDERIRRISIDRVQSNCLGWKDGVSAWCGQSGGKTIEAKINPAHHYNDVPKMTCAMPPGHLDKLLSHHMTCLTQSEHKLEFIHRWLNWTLIS